MASFTLSPSGIVVSSTGNVITLVGTATAWTSGTTFTYAGGTVTGKVWNSATSVVLTITAGGTTGSFNVSDGTLTAALIVAAMSISSSTLATDGRTMTVNIAGIGTSPLVPASGLLTGFSVVTPLWSGNVKAVAGSTAVTLTLPLAALSGDTVTVSYIPGNLNDSAGTPNTMGVQLTQAVTNSSTQTAMNTTQVAAANFATVPGLQAWFSADTGIYSDLGTTAATTDGTLVEQWNDRSGNANHMTQVTSGKRPLLKVGTNGINGNNALWFNTAPYMLLPSGLTNSTFDQSLTFFIVYKAYTVAASNVLIATTTTNFFISSNVTLDQLPATNVDTNQAFSVNTVKATFANTTPTAQANGNIGADTCVATAYYDGTSCFLGANGMTSQMRQTRSTGVFPSLSLLTTGNIGLTGQLAIGGSNTGTSSLNAFVCEILICNQALTLTQRQQIEAGLYTKYSIQPDAYNIYDGDSLTFGTNAGVGCEYPAQVQQLLGNGNYWANYGIGGQTIATMLANVNSKIVPNVSLGRKRNTLTVWSGTNDIAVSGRTAAATYADLVSYCQAARAAGFKVIVLTMLPRTTGGSGTETSRQTYNGLILAGWPTFADALADVGGNSTILGAPNAYTNTVYYFTDQIHLTNIGYNIVAKTVTNAINGLYSGSGSVVRSTYVVSSDTIPIY